MTALRVLVAEDEPLARRMVADLVRRDPDVDTVIECADGRSALATLQSERIDIALLDIEMPEATGMELARQVGSGGPVVIFVTAFSRYAADAFDVLAVDYVLKPFSDERFAAALDRAKTRVRERRLAALASQLATVAGELTRAPGEPQAYTTRLTFRQGERSILVSTSEILWLEAEDYYVLVHTSRGRHMVREALASFEERLDPQRFLRVHRAAIVNIDAVREVQDAGSLMLLLSDGARVPVSRSRRRRVEDVLRPRLSH